ncbi:hypothetical protein BC939DRAFT_469229 [Gamsiella multidivaricata]|uniref:uncharacterized protein n=1 Tax=Gamsiella multidivaricata TaxID=101098 RepID=UPI00221F71DC|nr:uncharacterized protein BC939DRAFT_469229 [Gamsiella multidivaricata]KAI7816402.1 hypothetical protein BC939DRAFT_469229 [Gamsiella multidivaricata]
MIQQLDRHKLKGSREEIVTTCTRRKPSGAQNPSVCPAVCPTACPSVCPTVCPAVSPSIYQVFAQVLAQVPTLHSFLPDLQSCALWCPRFGTAISPQLPGRSSLPS